MTLAVVTLWLGDAEFGLLTMLVFATGFGGWLLLPVRLPRCRQRCVPRSCPD